MTTQSTTDQNKIISQITGDVLATIAPLTDGGWVATDLEGGIFKGLTRNDVVEEVVTSTPVWVDTTREGLTKSTKGVRVKVLESKRTPLPLQSRMALGYDDRYTHRVQCLVQPLTAEQIAEEDTAKAHAKLLDDLFKFVGRHHTRVTRHAPNPCLRGVLVKIPPRGNLDKTVRTMAVDTDTVLCHQRVSTKRGVTGLLIKVERDALDDEINAILDDITQS